MDKLKTYKTIFKTIVGSQAYGTSTPSSDVDYKGVYVQPDSDVLSFNYVEQVEVGKDECYYEIRRFLQLAETANPTMLELLFMHDEAIISSSDEFNLVRKHRHRFLTKKCCMSFGGYAIAQIKKARGLDKKMNWEKERIERKTPVDFCYVYDNGKTFPVMDWLKKRGINNVDVGLVALDHFKDCYAVYHGAGLGFKGISMDDSNAIRLSSIPKEHASPVTVMYYNKDAYSIHCKDYKSYVTWMENRNTQRYVDIKGHDQQIDGKNLLHCRRLLDMAMEIAITGDLTVYRPNREYLLKIRRGEVPLEEIITNAESDIEKMDDLYAASRLPESVDRNFVNNLLLEVRAINSQKEQIA